MKTCAVATLASGVLAYIKKEVWPSEALEAAMIQREPSIGIMIDATGDTFATGPEPNSFVQVSDAVEVQASGEQRVSAWWPWGSSSSKESKAPQMPLATHFRDGEAVALRLPSGRYCADEGSRIKCNRDHPSTWETFKMHRISNGGPIRYAIQGGRYGRFCADSLSAVQCTGVHAPVPFEIFDAGQGKFVFRGSRGQYCSVTDGIFSCELDSQSDALAFVIDTVGARLPRLVKAGVECGSRGQRVGRSVDSIQECAAAADSAGGQFFIYGKGIKSGFCYVENTTSAECPEGWQSDLYDFYELTEMRGSMPSMRKADAECKSSGRNMGDKSTLQECAAAVEAAALTTDRAGKPLFFIFGKDSKRGNCYWELTDSESCKEGWEKDRYDFYELKQSQRSLPALVKADVECKCKGRYLGKFPSIQQCASAAERSGGLFFIFGKGRKAEKCYRENTVAAECPEGFERDLYDFYQLTQRGSVCAGFAPKADRICNPSSVLYDGDRCKQCCVEDNIKSGECLKHNAGDEDEDEEADDDAEKARSLAALRNAGVTVYSESGCRGPTVWVSALAREQHCENCWDVCGKNFDGAGAVAASLPSLSNIRSIKVTGPITADLFHPGAETGDGCFGGEIVVGDKNRFLMARASAEDACVDFADGGHRPTHIVFQPSLSAMGAVSPTALENCPGSFSEWTECSASCGQGTQTRSYSVPPGVRPVSGCPSDGLQQARKCGSLCKCAPGAAIRNQALIALEGPNGYCSAARTSGSGAVSCTSGKPTRLDAFRLIDAGSGKWALQASFGNKFCAAATGAVVCAADFAAAEEKFEIEQLQSGKVTIRAASGFFCSGDPLECDSADATEFSVKCIPEDTTQANEFTGQPVVIQARVGISSSSSAGIDQAHQDYIAASRQNPEQTWYAPSREAYQHVSEWEQGLDDDSGSSMYWYVGGGVLAIAGVAAFISHKAKASDEEEYDQLDDVDVDDEDGDKQWDSTFSEPYRGLGEVGETAEPWTSPEAMSLVSDGGEVPSSSA
mmetsp:Transcript_9008/g.21463  ORF Transcript_9008/g.21463 Transcript_9008/m.21463 type:complete len:1020 (-) Transcript_9008:69-3128(-)